MIRAGQRFRRRPVASFWRLFILVAALMPGLLVADSQDYVLEFPARQMIAYKIEFEVPHPGRLAMKANWSGNRVVTFKLQGPDGSPPEIRRSGPPPLRLHFDVTAELAGQPGPWLLSIRGLPVYEAAGGMLTLHLPDAAEAPVRPIASPAVPAAAPVEPVEPWLRPARAAEAVSQERERLFDTTEQLRLSVVQGETRDSYKWQNEMLRYLAAHRDGHATPLDQGTSLMLRRSADAVRKVHKLSVSTDPFVVDPPTDRGLHRAWLALRERRIAPIEMELDSMLHSIHKGHVPQLHEQPWFGRFVSCLIACEDHFEERGRLGDNRARNAEVVAEQWDRVLLAAEALDSLAAVAEAENRREQ